jgi:hypothetical protein
VNQEDTPEALADVDYSRRDSGSPTVMDTAVDEEADPFLGVTAATGGGGGGGNGCGGLEGSGAEAAAARSAG